MERRGFLGLFTSAVAVAAAAPVVAKAGMFDQHLSGTSNFRTKSSAHSRSNLVIRNSDTRILSLFHAHTEKSLDIAYKQGNEFDSSALVKLNDFLKDFRTGETRYIDPRLFDILFDVRKILGDSGARYTVLSGYRSPMTNNMLRRRGSGVARNSLHIQGRAIDITFADIPMSTVRQAALSVGRGGVGYYRRSNFVHMDTGPVRSWGA